MPSTSLCLWSEQEARATAKEEPIHLLNCAHINFAGSTCVDVACNAQTACTPLMSMLITLVAHMQVLDRRWFYGKRCLDIGCNEGVITLAAVQRFAPLSMLGVDIDEGLIKTACRYALAVMTSWAVSFIIRLLNTLTPKGVVFSFLFLWRHRECVAALFSRSATTCTLAQLQSPRYTVMSLTMWSGI